MRGLTGLREIAKVHRGSFRLTPNQNLLIADVADADRPQIDALVREHGLALHETASPVRLDALACVALPTCPLAMAEAERCQSSSAASRACSSTWPRRRAAARARDRLPQRLRPAYLGEIGLVGKSAVATTCTSAPMAPASA
ncbi:MAG: hypothetical protein R3E65_11665 [Steroidobacteraceae bacterium]